MSGCSYASRPGADIARMISRARRNADRFHCDFLAVYVDQPGLSSDERSGLERDLAHAGASGAQVEVIEGDDPAEAVARFASSHGVTQIFVGHSRQTGWRTRFFGSPVNRLVRAARGMDVRVFSKLGHPSLCRNPSLAAISKSTSVMPRVWERPTR